MKKRIIRIAVIALIVLTVATGGGYFLVLDGFHQDQNKVFAEFLRETTVEVSKGTDISVAKSGTSNFTKIDKKEVLSQGDAVKTGPDSEAVIYWVDRSVTRLRGSSQVSITTLEFNQNEPTKTRIAFDLFSGEAWSKATTLLNEKASFSVRAGKSDVIAGVRGTTFDMSYKNNKANIKTIKHAVDLVGVKVVIPQGKETTLDTTDKISELKPQLVPIGKDFYDSSWWQGNSDEDKEYDLELRQDFIDDLREDIEDDNDFFDSLKFQTALRSGNPEDRAQAFFDEADERLRQALLAQATGDTEGYKQLLSEYDDLIGQARQEANTIGNENDRNDFFEQIQQQASIGLRYDEFLDDEDNDNYFEDSLENVILDYSYDDEEKKDQQELFERMDFYDFTDELGEDPDAVFSDEQYQDILEQFSQGQLEDHECTILEQYGSVWGERFNDPANCQPDEISPYDAEILEDYEEDPGFYDYSNEEPVYIPPEEDVNYEVPPRFDSSDSYDEAPGTPERTDSSETYTEPEYGAEEPAFYPEPEPDAYENNSDPEYDPPREPAPVPNREDPVAY